MAENLYERIAELVAVVQSPGHPMQARAYEELARHVPNMPPLVGMPGAGQPGQPGGQFPGGARPPIPTRDVGHNIITQDQIHPPMDGSFVTGMIAPSRYLTLPQAPAVPPATASGEIVLRFTAGAGLLVGWRARATQITALPFASGALEQDTMGVQMFINDGENLITNGENASFAALGTLFADAVHYSPILRMMDKSDTLTVVYQNFQPAIIGATLTPRMTFAFARLDKLTGKRTYPGLEL